MLPRENLPRELAVIVSRHLVDAMPLESHNPDGPTIYALTIRAVGRDGWGTASIAGPAVTPAGVTEDWPAAARGVARRVFEAPPQWRAGAVVVIAMLQLGSALHGAIHRLPAAEAAPAAVPAESTRRGGGRAPFPASCGAEAGHCA